MPAFQLLTAFSASLLLLARPGAAAQEGTTTTYAVTLDHQNACLAEINSARAKASLDDLIPVKQATGTGNTLPAASSVDSKALSSWVWQPVCQVVLPGEVKQEPAGVTSPTFSSGTYAFQIVDASIPSCDAVVDNWKKAYTNFSNELPPPRKDNDALYKQDNVSLVAIYNPSKDATADCQLVTCTKTVKAASKALQEAENGGQAGTVTKGYAVICMTTPDALSKDPNTAPFTDEQWEKIVSSIKGSASAVFPSLFIFAATLFGAVAMM